MRVPFGIEGSTDLKARNNFDKYVSLIFRSFIDKIVLPISTHFQLKRGL